MNNSSTNKVTHRRWATVESEAELLDTQGEAIYGASNPLGVDFQPEGEETQKVDARAYNAQHVH